MDLIYNSGFHISEAVCPYPMMRVRIEQYYQHWGDRIALFGGIPQSLLSDDTASEADLHNYLDHFFKAVAPGRRMIVGIADTTPPHADFNRLRIIGDRVADEGRLPLQAGSFNPVSESKLEQILYVIFL